MYKYSVLQFAVENGHRNGSVYNLFFWKSKNVCIPSGTVLQFAIEHGRLQLNYLLKSIKHGECPIRYVNVYQRALRKRPWREPAGPAGNVRWFVNLPSLR